MHKYPELIIDKKKLADNIREVTARCKARGISVAGVIKGMNGLPELIRVYAESDVEMIGSSRIEQIKDAVEIGRRATACGMKLLVDFHYSDFWADPGKQMVPRAWAGLDIDEKEIRLHEYTLDCMKQLKDAGVDVGMVQLGNETNGALCGEKIWRDIAHLMDAGSRAVREVYPDALIALHFANPENPDSYRTYASKMAYYEQYGLIQYDVFATSYYPYWHGTLDNLSTILTEISETYGKKVMVMETSYAFTTEDTDFSSNTIGDGGGIVKDYPHRGHRQLGGKSRALGKVRFRLGLQLRFRL